MSDCSICLEAAGSHGTPVCIPCGHIFCSECIIKAVRARNTGRNASCPTCRGSLWLTGDESDLRSHCFFGTVIRPILLDQAPAIQEYSQLKSKLADTLSCCVELEHKLSEANSQAESRDVSFVTQISMWRRKVLTLLVLLVLVLLLHAYSDMKQTEVEGELADSKEQLANLKEQLADADKQHRILHVLQFYLGCMALRRRQGNYQPLNLALGIFFISLSAFSSWFLPDSRVTIRLFLAFIVACVVSL